MNPLKPNPATPFAPFGMVPAPDEPSQLTVAADSVPTSIVPEAGFNKGKRTVDMYGQLTDRPDDSYIAITSADPNGRENPNAGDVVHTLRSPYCDTCKMSVAAELLANPATGHLGHDLSYKGKENQDVKGLGPVYFDVNGNAANPIGATGGSYFLQAGVKPTYQNPGQAFPEELQGDTRGTGYRWQADVDRSAGQGNNGKRPVLTGGGDLSKASRPYSGEVIGRLGDRIDDTDPPNRGAGLVRVGPSTNSQYAQPEATGDTVADQIEDHTLEQM